MLFEVAHIATKEVYTVYGVNPVKSISGGYNTLFLIFIKGEWRWVSTNHYVPKL